MKIVQVKTGDERTRYYLSKDDGSPVVPVLKYLQFKDNYGLARNTLRMQCIHLKHFFTYMEECEKDYQLITIDDLSSFIAWLKNSSIKKSVVTLRFEPEHQPQTINANIDTVIMFFDYLLRHEGMENHLSKKLVKFIQSPKKNYRGFLYGIADNKKVKSHILKLPVPKNRVKTITKKDTAILLETCRNMRDYFLLYLLFETGMRIGEALSLWLEDFDMSEYIIYVNDRGETENLAEIKTVSSPRKLNCTQELMDIFTEYVCKFHTYEIKTNHVFLKLKGLNSGKAMDYVDVDNLFRKLRKRTNIDITPHIFRHTSLSLLYAAGWQPELIRIRAGHKNIYTTMNTYVHPSDETIAEEFKKVSDALKMPPLDKEAEE